MSSSKIRTQQILFAGTILYHYATFYLERISSHVIKNICPTKPIRYLVCEVGRKAYVFFLLPSKFIPLNIFSYLNRLLNQPSHVRGGFVYSLLCCQVSSNTRSKKYIYGQTKITLCLVILVRVTCDTNSDKTSNSLRGRLSLHEELSGCDLLFRGPSELYFFFTSIYRHFVNNFALLTKPLHSFQINANFIIIIIMT